MQPQLQARIYISGIVQGVGFRWFVKSNAKRRGLTGWVKNTNGDRVEALVQGPKEMIKKLIKLCEKGPFLSQVKSVQVEWEPEIEHFESFEKLP
jgi:acylphosphatase